MSACCARVAISRSDLYGGRASVSALICKLIEQECSLPRKEAQNTQPQSRRMRSVEYAGLR
jgi:hypothetical protein